MLETPFTSAGDVDTASLLGLVDHLAAIGADALMYPGFASEYLKLTDAERDDQVLQVIVRAKEHGLTAVASVADHGTHAAVARAERYAAGGASLINILPPHQLGPGSDAVFAHLVAVIAAIAPTPAVLQYAPAQTGLALDAAMIGRLADVAPNLVQVKVEAQPPGRLVSALGQAAPRLTSVVGYAGLHLTDALRRGAVGVQPGCSFTELYLRVWDLWQSGDRPGATTLHQRMAPYLATWMQHVEFIVAAEKRISLLRGLIPSDICRAPGWTLDQEERSQIDRFLTEFARELATPVRRETAQ